MHVLITGAAGTLGARLARSIVADPPPGLMRLTLTDTTAPAAPAGAAVPIVTAALDLQDAEAITRRMARRPDVVFHLAAPDPADRDWSRGFDVARRLLDAVAATPDHAPRLVLASSVAVFGPPAPPVIPDDHAPAPATGFGAQLAAVELLLAERVRAGEIDGLALRLPAIAGLGAPWGFADWIAALLRDAPAGRPAVLPVEGERRLWLASSRAAVRHLRQAAEMDLAGLGPRRSLILPGVPVRAGEIVEALARVAGEDAAEQIRREIDPEAERAAAAWPGWFEASRARSLGFRPEVSLDALVAAELRDAGPSPAQSGKA